MYFISLLLLPFLFLFFSESLIQINIYSCWRDTVCNRDLTIHQRARMCTNPPPPFPVAHIVHCLLDSLQKPEFYWSSNVERNVTLHGVVFPNLSATLHSLVSEKFWLIFAVLLLQSTLWLTLVYWLPDPRMADVSLNFSIWNPFEKLLLWSSDRPVRTPAGVHLERDNSTG
jgi:hypothetical protein